MRASLWHSRKGLSAIVAEVLMLLIVIIMSSIVFIWVVPTFQSSTVTDNSGAAYAEKFSTQWGSFATFAPSTPETVYTCVGLITQIGTLIPSGMCPVSSPTTCTGTIGSAMPTTNIYVPPNGVCVIKASVGYVFADTGSSLTVANATIKGLVGNYSSSVIVSNVQIQGWTGLTNVQTVSISSSSLNTNGITTICTDGCNSAIYESGRGTLNFVNNTVTGQFESEVSHQAIITGNTITGRLEVESADFGQISNNKAGMLDLDQNGIVVVSGNTVYGNAPNPGPPNNTCPAGTGIAICYGYNSTSHAPGNRWCAAGNNVIVSGTVPNQSCVGNVEIDIANTGSVPVNLVAAYMTNIPLSGSISWKLISGGSSHSSLPIVIPVGQSANVTMQWTPPAGSFTMPWMDLYFIFVSSHDNFVDGHLYFGYNPALTIPSQSRPENRICPPCY